MSRHSNSSERLNVKEYRRTSSTPSATQYNNTNANNSSNASKRDFSRENSNSSRINVLPPRKESPDDDKDDEDLEEFYNKLKKNKQSINSSRK